MQFLKSLTLMIVVTAVLITASLVIMPSKLNIPFNPHYTAQAAPEDDAGSSSGNEEVNSDDRKEIIDKANSDDELSDEEENKLNTLIRQGQVEQEGGKYRVGVAAEADSSLWVLYSQILMDSEEGGDKKKKDDDGNMVEKGVKNAIGSFMGDGGVEINIPFNKMYSIGVDLDKAKKDKGNDDGKDTNTQAGRQLAAFFSTFSHYGYIETISGNKLAAQSDGAINSALRFVAGFTMIIALLFYEFFNTILGGAVSFIGTLDLFSIMGFSDSETLAKNTDNTFTKAIYGFVQGIGLSPHLFNLIVLAALWILVGLFVYRLMRTLSSQAFHFGQIGDHTRRFIVQFLVLFPIPILVVTLVSGFAGQLSELNSSPKFNPSPPEQYILNDRKWASALNLSPSGLEGGQVPNVGSEKQHIDGKYAPSSSRDLISQINTEAYTRMDGDASSKDIGFDLIFGYMQNNTFNVNTYMADIRQLPANSDKDITEAYSAYQNTDDLSKKVTQQNYDDYIWTSKPVSDSNAKEAKPTHNNFKSSSTAGVDGDSSFSTQSVALMLQTSFENHAANFYAYNIPPQGLQGQAKNMSTVKTEWREYTMPGEGLIGKAGSYLAVVTQSLFQALIIFGCIHALIFTNFFKSAILTIKHWFMAAGTGNPVHMLIALILGLTSPLTAFVAYALPSLFISLINVFASGMNGIVRAIGIQNIDGIIDIGKSLVFIFLGFYLIIAKTFTGKNVITTIIDFPTEMGLDLARKASRIMRSRQQMRQAMRFAGQSARATGQASGKDVANSMSRGTFSQTYSAMRNPSDWSGHGASYLKNQQFDGNNASNGQSAKDFASDTGKGIDSNSVDANNIESNNNTSGANFATGVAGGAAVGGIAGSAAGTSGSTTGRTGTARNTLLGYRNPNENSNQSTNPYGNRNYFNHQAPNGSPANIQTSGSSQQGGQSKNDIQDTENHQRNNMFKNSANQLPSAMKNGSAKEFAQDINKENAEKEAIQNGENQAKEDIKRAESQFDTPNNNGNNTQSSRAADVSEASNNTPSSNRQSNASYNRDNMESGTASQFDNADAASTASSNASYAGGNVSQETAKDFAAQQPPFNDTELKSLNNAKDESDFQEKLYFTNNGQYTALSQDSAKQELAGTDFVNKDGDVNYDKVDEFNNSINGKHVEDLDEVRMKQKEQIDFAFRKGASSIYDQSQNVDEVDNNKGNNN
ncbi:DUF4013 domain-containing protein [Staphylococcus equorum]|uniref:DUF4013 domain-containing protein n=1 Tax=Staphylococcus equorum TaxID=246432 RepID=A0A9X4LAW4_9STAP|nr:DUF4013 domain-containing protein [Staphylococcus equorum]MDG0820734.1 DUF4013 domain-containing protein [Staphylococcus equorum]MDG0841359.1 DUF4013 domain-containing protein [Staphylococcus equorum]MDG0847059.1 DUF4013 domain-containing protein [Staphylococcus equorum]PTE82335.1 hypothetical protein BUY85_00935 [Staphylococcus equorum]